MSIDFLRNFKNRKLEADIEVEGFGLIPFNRPSDNDMLEYLNGAARGAKIKDGEIIEIRENAEAYRKDGFNPHTIRAACRSDKKTHKGFGWRYLD